MIKGLKSDYAFQDEVVRIPARAKFEFVGHSDNEYSLKKGQSVIVTSRRDENWYIVESVDGSRTGMVPSTYLEVYYLSFS